MARLVLSRRKLFCTSNYSGDTGRSERIRTSDPLLPKQVRYQAALRSDLEGRVKPNAGAMQGGAGGYSPGSRGPFPNSVPTRGSTPVSGRRRDRLTGWVVSTLPPPSRSTM